MALDTAILDPLFLRKFGRLVLGCSEADVRKQIFVAQDFSRYATLANFCTALASKIKHDFVKKS